MKSGNSNKTKLQRNKIWTVWQQEPSLTDFSLLQLTSSIVLTRNYLSSTDGRITSSVWYTCWSYNKYRNHFQRFGFKFYFKTTFKGRFCLQYVWKGAVSRNHLLSCVLVKTKTPDIHFFFYYSFLECAWRLSSVQFSILILTIRPIPGHRRVCHSNTSFHLLYP